MNGTVGVYVTVEELGALLGAGAPADRLALAVDAANYLITRWARDTVPVTAPEYPPTEPAPVTPALRQAGLELSHTLYRRHAAVGGVFTVDDLVSRLPAELVRSIRDLLNVDRRAWGIG